MTNDDDIGYRRPPKRTRWQKGQSGNPQGRPKSRPEYLDDAAAILSQPVTAKSANGESVRLDGIEAAYLALCKKGLSGHKASLLDAIRIMLDVGMAVEERRSDEAASRARAREILEKLGMPIPNHLRG